MKISSKILLTIIGAFLGSSAFAGGTSAGGLLRPESAISCFYNDENGYHIDFQLELEPTWSSYNGVIHQSSPSGFYAPIEFSSIERIQDTDSQIDYLGSGFRLSIDLNSALPTVIPPLYIGYIQIPSIGNAPVKEVRCQLFL